MRQFLLIGLLLAATLAGCGGVSDEAEETSEHLGRKNAETAEEFIRESDRGFDESGDRVWKQEARAFFDYDRNPSNSTFELHPQWARDFTEFAYAAGAPNVWVTGISEFEIGGSTLNIADNIVIELPKQAAQRAEIFDAYNAELQEAGLQPLADVGQNYLFIAGD